MNYVFCMKWGKVYGPKDVNILHGMVSRNLTIPHEFICFTDDPEGINPAVRCLPLPDLGCEIPKDVPGKWNKVALWSEKLFDLEGVALFIDLDTVIVGNIDGYFTYGDPKDVITARNWVRVFRKSGQTSVFRFPIGGHPYMLENLRKDPVTISRKYQFEQNYVTANIRGGIKFWPEEWTRHFRLHCAGSWVKRYLRPPVLPPMAKVITFPGLPKPGDALLGRWNGNAVHRGRRDHIAWSWSQRRGGKGFRRNLGRFLFPSAWMREHWKE